MFKCFFHQARYSLGAPSVVEGRNSFAQNAIIAGPIVFMDFANYKLKVRGFCIPKHDKMLCFYFVIHVALFGLGSQTSIVLVTMLDRKKTLCH